MHPPARVWFLVAGLAVTLTAFVAWGADRAPGFNSIDAADLREHVRALTTEDMAGRLIGTAGNERATRRIAERFRVLGLSPAGDNLNFLRRFDLATATLGEANLLRVTNGHETVTGELGIDFHPEPYSGSGRGSGSVVFVGFGIVAPAVGHDDYRQVDVAGRVVVILDHEPAEYDPTSVFDGTARSDHARAVWKTLEAQRRGAVAVVMVPDAHNHGANTSVRASMEQAWRAASTQVPAYQLSAWVNQVQIPAVRVSGSYAARLLGVAPDESLHTLTGGAETDGGMQPFEPPPVEVAVVVETAVERQHTPLHNVVAMMEGVDPSVRDEWVLICAHLDHDGVTSRGLFPGADDNASGIAGLLEVAEAYAVAKAAGRAPRRSVLFAAWNGEERGLLGSWAYTEHPLAPLHQTVAFLNMDMIGRHEEVPEQGGARFRGLSPQTAASNTNAVNLLGYSYSDDLRQVAERSERVAQTRLGLRFRYDDNESDLLRRSDHWPFLFRGVPAMFIHTGLHPDYHTERDTADRLDYEKMTRITRLVHQMSWDLAEAETRPSFIDPRRPSR